MLRLLNSVVCLYNNSSTIYCGLMASINSSPVLDAMESSTPVIKPASSRFTIRTIELNGTDGSPVVCKDKKEDPSALVVEEGQSLIKTLISFSSKFKVA